MARTALAVVLLLVGWGAGLLLFFPTAALENRIENEITAQLHGKGHLVMEEVALRLPLALSARQAMLHLNQSPIAEIPVTELRVKPLWLSLPTGNPGLAFEGAIMGGHAEGFVRRRGEIHLELSNLQLAFPLLKNSTLAVAGTLARGQLSAHWPPVENAENYLSLSIDNVEVTGLDAIGAASKKLELGTLVLQGNGTGNSFKLDRIESSDGQLSMTGSGTLLLANPIEKSRINLSGSLKPTPEFDPQLLDLLKTFSKEVAGNFPFTISGTLSRPQIK